MEAYAAMSARCVRLVSSVAVVGRDNEPIYLRGDLCNNIDGATTAVDEATTTASWSVQRQREAEGGGEKEGDGGDASDTVNSGDGGGKDDGSGGNGKGLFGRFKGAIGKSNPPNEGERSTGARSGDGDDDNDDDNDDPFGFFENNSNPLQSSSSGAMSLTQQLVLHASLDRFDEMASRSNRGGAVRWRTPGSGNPNNAMWMGLLCQVEERWNVYGYLTNTGIKFMILVENIYVDKDGSRLHHRQDCTPLLLFDSDDSTMSPLSSKGASGNREADLKNMFAQLHELYVRHTLNPFSKLRSPIQSRVFDTGIVNMAQSFNSATLERVTSSVGGVYWG